MYNGARFAMTCKFRFFIIFGLLGSGFGMASPSAAVLDQLAQDLSARTGTEITFPRYQTNTATHRKTRVEDLSDATFAALMDFTEVDYQLLVHLYDRPVRSKTAAE